MALVNPVLSNVLFKILEMDLFDVFGNSEDVSTVRLNESLFIDMLSIYLFFFLMGLGCLR